ncbi:unnamed protein product [Larinioides sclopetarius]|uniref:Uncharacterized protein n=1 Tax=Larinioides sclopetarius TaxID=280406 RepID=A0AAV2BHV3_9ARAC
MATRGAPSHNPPGKWGWSSHIGPLICSCALNRTKHAPRPPFRQRSWRNTSFPRIFSGVDCGGRYSEEQDFLPPPYPNP